MQIIFTYFGGEVLRTAVLNLQEWVYVTLMAILIIPWDLTRKIIRNSVVKPDIVVGRIVREGTAALEWAMTRNENK